MAKLFQAGLFLTLPLLAVTTQLSEDIAHARAIQQSGNFIGARKEFQHAIAKARQQGDSASQALSLSGLAQADLALGHYADTITEGMDAGALFRALKNKAEEARILTTVGQARFYSGEYADALKDFEAGLDLARATGDREAEITRLNNIGGAYYAEGRYGEALRRYQLAEERLKTARNEPWFRSRSLLTSANLAVLFQRLGQYKRALAIYSGMEGDPKALPDRERAQLLVNTGTLYRHLGDAVAAIENYRAAQKIYSQSALLSGEVAVLNNIGIAQTLDLGNPRAAIATFTEALRKGEKSGGKQLIMTSLLYRGEALLRAGELAPAAADFEASGHIAAELKSEEEQWRADYGLARAVARGGDIARSHELLLRSIGVIETMRQGASAASGRAGFLIDRRDVYDLLIEQQASQPRPDVATLFRLMEQSRARDLRDHTGVHVSDLDALRQRLPADTLLLEYWMGEHSLAVIAISKADARLVYRPMTEATEAGMDALRRLPAILADPQQSNWETPARQAAALLIGGLDELKRTGLRRVIVVPDGDLARIPFEALPAGDQPGTLMIDRVSISYLPFASAFRAGHERRRIVPPWTHTLIAFADPVPGAGGTGLAGLAGLAMSGGENQQLPHAAREVLHAAGAAGGAARIYLGRSARKQRLIENTERVPLLHFATHAFADPDDPERSYILFAAGDGQSMGFDYLFLREVAGLAAARGSLVVISACDSGSGRLTRGEGVQSFASAFLSAGARGVVASLWRAGDKPSEEFMARFYDSLAAGNDASGALREARLAFRRSPGSASHPAYWAGFVLTGDSTVRIPRAISWKLAIAGLLAAAAVFAGALAGFWKIRTRAGTV